MRGPDGCKYVAMQIMLLPPHRVANANNVVAAASDTTISSLSGGSSSPKAKYSAMLLSSKASNNNNEPRKRSKSKVSFAEEVVKVDGSKVVIKEEHGVFLGPLLGRMVVSDHRSDADDNDIISTNTTSTSSSPIISFANDEHTKKKLSYSESSDGILKCDTTTTNNDHGNSNTVEYDNLVVRLGLLKIGHRYQVVVPIPNYWGQKEGESGDDTATTTNINNTTDNDGDHKVLINSQLQPINMSVQMVEESLDDDLVGKVQTDPSKVQYYVCITLSARRRGAYRGRFVLELTRIEQSKLDEATANSTATATNNDSNLIIPNKCLMSIQCDATIMGKDMGTPKLRNGVICLGKIVGYDSDDETEWQGFDT